MGNFGVLVNNDSQKILRMAPVFDNNRALCFDLDDDQLTNAAWYLRRMRFAIGSDFIATARGLMTDSIRQELLNLKGFGFRQHAAIPAEQKHLNLLSDIVNGQLKEILK